MESGERKFDADALEQALAAVEKADVTEERDTPRAVIMAMYPRLQEVMAAKQMSVRQLYQALKQQMDLPISEKTFSTYLQAAKKMAEGEKSRRGRKRGTKVSGDLTRETAANNAEAEAGPAAAGQGAEGEDETEAGRGRMEEPPADAVVNTEPADAKARFEAHETALDDDMAALAAKYGKKE